MASAFLLSLHIVSAYTDRQQLRVRQGRASCARASPRAAPRDLSAARAENLAFHADECRRSESLFFSHAPRPGSAAGADGPAPACAWEAFGFSGDAAHGLDGAPPALFGWADLAAVSRAPLFSAEECAAVIAEAEADPAWRGAAPQASYAENGATFRPVHELPRAAAWLDAALERAIFPAIASAFPAVAELAPHHLRISAASIVKYNASAGQTRLGVHRDGPLVAATVPLNGLGEYDGGGTLIEALLDTGGGAGAAEPTASPGGPAAGGHERGALRRGAGYLIIHPATVRHGGAPITRGLRYILVAWAFSAAHVPHAHHSTQRAARILAQALRIPRAAGSAYRAELLAAAADGFGEAIGLGAARLTESAHVGLGQSLLELGEADGARRAEQALREALSIAPRSAHAAALLALAVARCAAEAEEAPAEQQRS